MIDKILLDAIENAKNEIAANRRVARHNLTADTDDIIPYGNSDYLDMVSLMLESLREQSLVDKT